MSKYATARFRWGTRRQWEQILAVTERAFGASTGQFTADWPHSFTGAEAARRCVVAELEDGTLAGALNTVPIRLRFGRCTLPATIIGGVGVDPACRGRGIMSGMIGFAHEQLRSRGCAVSLLWGSRQRYAHFGYEIAGQSHYITVARTALAGAGAAMARVRQLGPRDAKAVLALHRRDRSSVVRGLPWQQRLLASRRTQAWGDHRGSAYAVVAERSPFAGDVLETAGDPISIARVLAAVMQRRRVERIRVWCAPGSAAAEMLYPLVEQTFGTDMHVHAATHVAILDFSRFLQLVAPAIGRRLTQLGVDRPLVLACSDLHVRVLLGPASDGPHVEPAPSSSRAVASLDARTWVRQFFAPPGATMVDGPINGLPPACFALPLIYPPWDIA